MYENIPGSTLKLPDDIIKTKLKFLRYEKLYYYWKELLLCFCGLTCDFFVTAWLFIHDYLFIVVSGVCHSKYYEYHKSQTLKRLSMYISPY